MRASIQSQIRLVSREPQQNRTRKINRARKPHAAVAPLSVPLLGMSGKQWYRGAATLQTATSGHGFDELVVELEQPYEKKGENYDLGSLRSLHPYRALVELSEQCDPPGAQTADDIFYGCLDPSPRAQRLVRAFTQANGLLDYPPLHCCERPELRLGVVKQPDDSLDELLYPKDEERTRTRYTWPFFPGPETTNLANPVGWVLWEALVLRCASNIWDAMEAYRQGGAITPLVRAVDKWSPIPRAVRETGEPLAWRPPTMQRAALMGWYAQFYLEYNLLSPHIAQARIGPRFALFPDELGHKPIGQLTRQDLRRSMPSFLLFPSSLLNAYWLQLYEDIQKGDGAGRICHGCGMRFQPSRADAVYHSPACGAKFRARRWREEHPKKMTPKSGKESPQ